MLAGVLALELLVSASSKNSVLVVWWSGSAQLGLRAFYLSELQVGRGAPPCVSEGLLGLLIEVVVLKAAHREREFVVRLQRAVGSVKWQDMQRRSSPLQHMQRAGTQSGGTEGCITQERQRQCAASHKSVVHWQSRIALAKITHFGPDAGSRKEKGPNSLKFVRGETYHILVSAPLAASAGARVAAPSAPKWLDERLRLVSEPLTRRASAIAVMPSAV